VAVSESSSRQLADGIRSVTGKSTVERVVDELRRAIMSGALLAGEEFSTADLAAQLEVSHIPVREALQRLEAEGLVVLRAGRRARVAPIDETDVRDAYRLWNLVSDDVVGRACERYSEEDLLAMAMHLGVLSSTSPDDDRAFASHADFHWALLKPGATAWDVRLLNQLGTAIQRGVRLAYGDVKLHRESAYEEHLPLLEAARAWDPKALRRALREHQESHMKLVVEVLESQHDETPPKDQPDTE
jgi:DNA-binding GntR family transcriptional regulator